MTGTIRQGKGVRREAESEESRRRNRGLDVQKPDMRPLQCWVTQPGMGKPNCHSERCGVDPAGLREEGESYLRRSPLWSVHTGLPAAAMQRDRSGEVSRGRSSSTGRRAESLMQGADERFRWTHNTRKAKSTTATAGRAEPVSRSMDGNRRLRHSFNN